MDTLYIYIYNICVYMLYVMYHIYVYISCMCVYTYMCTQRTECMVMITEGLGDIGNHMQRRSHPLLQITLCIYVYTRSVQKVSSHVI